MGWQLLKNRVDFTCCAVTHIGNYRKNHEDNFYMGETLTSEEQASLRQSGIKYVRKVFHMDNGEPHICAVSDGMGGHENGETASRMVVDALRRFHDSGTGRACCGRRDKFTYIEKFQSMIRRTNQRMLKQDEGKSGRECMGATLSGLILFADEAVPFNIGDSAVYVFENGGLQKLTVDDARVERDGTNRYLTKYFGLPEEQGLLAAAVSPPVAFREDQMFLIVSDGLTDSLRMERIAEILEKNGQDAGKTADTLIESALREEDGGRDNITVVVLKIQKTIKRRKLLWREAT